MKLGTLRQGLLRHCRHRRLQIVDVSAVPPTALRRGDVQVQDLAVAARKRVGAVPLAYARPSRPAPVRGVSAHVAHVRSL